MWKSSVLWPCTPQTKKRRCKQMKGSCFSLMQLEIERQVVQGQSDSFIASLRFRSTYTQVLFHLHWLRAREWKRQSFRNKVCTIHPYLLPALSWLFLHTLTDFLFLSPLSSFCYFICGMLLVVNFTFSLWFRDISLGV